MIDIQPGYILRNHDTLTAHANNWRDAEVLRVGTTGLDCLPLARISPYGKPLEPFVVTRVVLERLLAAGKWEIIPVVEDVTGHARRSL